MRTRKIIIDKIRLLGGMSIGGITLLIFGLLLPVTALASSALEDGTLVTKSEAIASVYLQPTISLSVSKQININAIPEIGGSLSFGEADIKISTNNTTGYSVFLSTADQTNHLNQVVNFQYSDSQEQYYIDTLHNTITANDYLSSGSNLNTWGYALTSGETNGDTVYSGLDSAEGSKIYTTNSTMHDDDYKLSIAVAVDTTLPAGEYSNGLIITAVTNPIAISSLNQLTYMQEMTPEICEGSAEHETKQLIDSRDGKSYWVAKLKDGNCWMTQNLALDLDTNEDGNAVAVSANGTKTKLDWSNTDIDDVWRGVEKTETTIPTTNSTKNYLSTRSWNLGGIALNNPTKSGSCGSFSASGSLVSCNWFDDISGLEDSYIATETKSVDLENNSYDAHYLIGNYYSWGAATANSGVETDSLNTDSTKLIDATSSICPKGWKLPTSGKNIATGRPINREYSFYQLLYAYGYPSTENSSNWTSGFADINFGNAVRLDYMPMAFVRGGYIDPTNNSPLRDTGSAGFYWSSTAYQKSSTSAYRMGFSSLVYPAFNEDRYTGRSIRCLAR